MDHLLILRHAEDDERGLSIRGRNSVKKLSLAIKPYFKGESYFLSSSAPRAEATTRALIEDLRVASGITYTPLLWTGSDGSRESFYRDEKEMANLHQRIIELGKITDTMVVVGHKELVEWYPHHYLWEAYRAVIREVPEIKRGEGFYLDLTRQSYQIVGENVLAPVLITSLPQAEKFCRLCDLVSNTTLCNDEQRWKAVAGGECCSAQISGRAVDFKDTIIKVSYGLIVDYDKTEEGVNEFKRVIEENNKPLHGGTRGNDRGGLEEDDVPF